MVMLAPRTLLFLRPVTAVFALAFAIAWVVVVSPGPMAQPIPAGVVERIQGDVLAVQNALTRPLAPGSEVFVGDILSTGTGSRVEIRMRDEAIFVLGEQTSFVIIDYTFGGAGNPSAIMKLIQGAFLATSGLIAESGANTMTVETSVATIGIRGTTVWGGSLDGLFGVVMLEGTAISVTNAAGQVELTEPNAGTRVPGPGDSPTVPMPWGREILTRAAASVAFDTP